MKIGIDLESYIQYVYSCLLNMNDYEDVIVSKNVTIQGIGIKKRIYIFTA